MRKFYFWKIKIFIILGEMICERERQRRKKTGHVEARRDGSCLATEDIIIPCRSERAVAHVLHFSFFNW